jgi:hypothetical protein
MNDQKIPVKQFIDPNTLKVPSKKAATFELTPEAANSTVPSCLESENTAETINDSGSTSIIPSDSSVITPEVLPPKNELLTALWRTPELCHQISVVNKRTSNKFSNISVKDADEAVQSAQQFSDSGFDVYFVCAEYLTANNRRADNVAGACGLWLDIDCGEAKWIAGKGYPTVEEAEEAIQRFCNDTGLPSPR